MIQIGRIGTVLFFIISGFLLFNKVERFTPLSYLRYRLNSVIKPWALFVLLLVFIQLFDDVSFSEIFTGNLSHILTLFWVLVKGTIFHAAYWFIPVAIISSVILIAFKKYVGKLWFGLLLAAVSFFYGVNLYNAWLPVGHTQAVFGYMFYLWLGMFIKQHINAVSHLLKNFSAIILFSITVIVFWLSCREGMILKYMGCLDAFGSLRLSNALFSILLFMVLLKSHRLTFLDRLHPQQNAYGIYLVHSVVIMELAPFANRFIKVQQLHSSVMQLATIQLLFFTCVFALTFAIVMIIRQSPGKFLVGIQLPDFLNNSTQLSLKQPFKRYTGTYIPWCSI